MHFTLADLTADIAQNGAESGAGIVELDVHETYSLGDMEHQAVNEFRFIVRDNGKGMSAAELDRAMDPFVTDGVKHPGRKVGLGLPFLVQTAVQSGGGWQINSAKAGEEAVVRKGGTASESDVTEKAGGIAEKAPGIAEKEPGGTGTTVDAWFDLANVDTPPLGDIPGLFRTVLLFTGPEETVFKRSRKGGEKPDLDYEMRKTELIEALGDLEDASSLILLGKYLRSLEGEDNE